MSWPKRRVSSSMEILLFFTPFCLICFDLDQNLNILKFPVNWISENVIQKLPTWKPVATLVLLPKVPCLWLQLEGGNTDAWLPYIGSGCPGVTKSEIPVTKHQPWCGPSAEPRVSMVSGFWEAPRNSALPWVLLRLLRTCMVQITHFSVWNTLFSELSFLSY